MRIRYKIQASFPFTFLSSFESFLTRLNVILRWFIFALELNFCCFSSQENFAAQQVIFAAQQRLGKDKQISGADQQNLEA